ncbi:serpin family protein [Indiicoccus explosivorum]|uniref:serpin family protein n=1 Tax=Indiicoccus explosivorum TaxID=1917864 RepID=UPI000B455310|nr:serpin family protein [Indiicoccus explosivorum]
MNGTVKTLMAAGVALVLTGCGTEEQETAGDVKTLEIAADVEYGKEDYKKIVNANNELGMELMAEVPADGDGNTFISPLSLYMALSMLYNGAAGETKAEIAEVLNASIPPEEMNKANASLMVMLADNSESVQLDIANSIWLNETYDFQQEFAESNRDYFNAKIEEIDVTDSESSDRINDWVSGRTNGMIDKMVPKPLDPNLVTILLNAIYFKGEWTEPFEEKNTEDRPFRLHNGESVDVPLMTAKRYWDYMETDQFQAAILPYGDREAGMYVFLPKTGSSLEEFEAGLTPENWKSWRQQFDYREGTLSIPKFELEYGVLLNDALKTLGMETAFMDSNLSGMLEGGGGTISEVKQKTALKVDEKGTEAAAATSITVPTEGSAEGPFTMTVDRPFFLAIEDTETRTLLFMGSIADPVSK